MRGRPVCDATKNRLENLKDYAAQIKYPHISVLRWLFRLLALYAILHLIVASIHVWHARDKATSLGEIWPVQESVATLKLVDTTPQSDSTVQESTDEAEADSASTPLAGTSSPKDSPNKIVQPPTIVQQVDEVSTAYSQNEIRIAERDLRYLSARNMTSGRVASKNAPLDIWMVAEIDEIHRSTFAIWSASRELLDLGMRIDEVLKSRKDLVYGCIIIRRKTCNKINELISSAEYQKALKLYKTVNTEFSNNGFEEIPRPSFTPNNVD